MLKIEGLLALLSLGLGIYCLIEVISTPDHQVRNLPKIGWILLVLLFPLVGSIAWLAVGRPMASSGAARTPGRPVPHFPEYDRPGRAAASSPDADEEFLRQVRAKAEEQRRRYREQKAREAQGEAGQRPDPPVEPTGEDESPGQE